MDPFTFGVGRHLDLPAPETYIINHSRDERCKEDTGAYEIPGIVYIMAFMRIHYLGTNLKAAQLLATHIDATNAIAPGGPTPAIDSETPTLIVYAHFERPEKKYDLTSAWRAISGPWSERPKCAPYDQGGIPYRGLERVVNGVYQFGIKINLEHVRQTDKSCDEVLMDFWNPLQHGVLTRDITEPAAFTREVKFELSQSTMRQLCSRGLLDDDAKRTLFAHCLFDRVDVNRDEAVQEWLEAKAGLEAIGAPEAAFMTEMLERYGAIPPRGGPKRFAPVPESFRPLFANLNLA